MTDICRREPGSTYKNLYGLFPFKDEPRIPALITVHLSNKVKERDATVLKQTS